MNVRFLNIISREDFPSEADRPLAYLLLGNYLEHTVPDVTIDCVDMLLDEAPLVLPTGSENCDILAVQLTYDNAVQALECLARLKNLNNGPMVIAGGVFAGVVAQELVRDYDVLDFVVIGEGERPMQELIIYLKGKTTLENVKGVVYKNGDTIIVQPQEKPIPMDTLKFPKRPFISRARPEIVRSDGARIQTARGCIGACSYCANSHKNRLDKITTKIWRGRSPKHVVDELIYLKEQFGYRIFNFVDPSIEDPGRLGKIRLRELCERIIDADLHISFKANMRTETIHPEKEIDLLKLLKKAGLDVIVLGMEAATKEELRLFCKNARYETAKRFCNKLSEMDMFCVVTGWIPIHPYATPETLRTNYQAMAETEGLWNLQLLVQCLLPLRGTNIYDKLVAEDLILNHNQYLNAPLAKMTNPTIARLHAGLQEIKVSFPNVFKDFHFLFLKIYNTWARSTNSMFTAKRPIEPCFSNYDRDFKAVKRTLETQLLDLRIQLLEAAEAGVDAPGEYVQLAATGFSGLDRLEKKLNEMHHSFIMSMTDLGHDTSIFKWKAWGSRVFEQVKL